MGQFVRADRRSLPTREATRAQGGLQGFLIPNAGNRYQLSTTSALTRNADGSADVCFQATEPSDPAQAANWLPTAAGQGFEGMWRLLAPTPGRIPGILDGSGWQPPAITPAPTPVP